MELQGEIRHELTDLRDFTRWSVTLVEECKEVQRAWQQSLADDHKISDKEAIEIENEIKDILGALVFFYVTLEKEAKEALTADNLTLAINGSSWNVKVGKEPNKVELVDFFKWYRQLLHKKIRGLFSEYLEALADGVVSDEEQASLQDRLLAIIKELVYVILVLRRGDA